MTQDVTGPAVGVAGCRGMAEPLDGVARPRRRSGRRVRSQVALQQCAVREDLAAGGAGRALRPVCAHVHVERALLREALGADGALEGAHARVRDHMLEQVVAQRERSPAHGALVGLLACGRQGRPRTHGQPGRDPPPSLDQLSIQNPLRERALPPLPDLAAQQRSPGMGRYVLSPPPSWDIPLPDPYLTSYHNTTDCRGPATVTGTLLPWSPASVGCCCLLRLTTQVTPIIQGPPCPDLCSAGHPELWSLAAVLGTAWQGLAPVQWETQSTCPGLPESELLPAGHSNGTRVTEQAASHSGFQKGGEGCVDPRNHRC